MKAAIITMQWPAWSETFVARDILTLVKNNDLDIDIYALRPSPKDGTAIKQSHGTSDINDYSGTPYRYIVGLFLMMRYLHYCFFLFKLIIRHEDNSKPALRSIMLVPICFWIWNAIRKKEYDVVHLYWAHYPSLIGLLLKHSEWHGVITMNFVAYDLREDYKLSRVMAARVHHIFTISEFNKELLIQRGIDGNQITVNYGGINIDSNQGIIHNDQRIETDLLYVGRLIPEKGIHDLLTIFKKTSHPNIRLHIVGDGPAFKHIENDVGHHPHVIIHGRKSPTDVMNLMQRVGIVVHPSHVEMIPNVIKEAMAHGAIVLSSKTDGIDEIITDGKNGFLGNIHDHTQFMQILLKILELSPAKKTDIRDNAALSIRDKFDVEKNMAILKNQWMDEA